MNQAIKPGTTRGNATAKGKNSVNETVIEGIFGVSNRILISLASGNMIYRRDEYKNS
ncbi:hypothetical protein ACFOHW_25985 [Paenibacillus abyssi]|uniref:hypothetical protein n=1 Tax=Paenibacillus abyssi TaxID=1340531 RepID=UPI0036185667